MAEQVNRSNEQEQDLKQILKVRRDKLKALQDGTVIKVDVALWRGLSLLSGNVVTQLPSHLVLSLIHISAISFNVSWSTVLPK